MLLAALLTITATGIIIANAVTIHVTIATIFKQMDTLPYVLAFAEFPFEAESFACYKILTILYMFDSLLIQQNTQQE